MLRYLSHTITPIMSVHGSVKEEVELRQVKSIEKGDSSQVYWLGLGNHWGTHVDCPAHFFPKGAKVSDYQADFWLFNNPQVLPIKAAPGQIITFDDLGCQINPQTDLLLFKSGWKEFRGKEVYSLKNPAIHPSLGLKLRKECPEIRAIGFDWVSMSSCSRRELGREAHRAFLDPQGKGKPILIIEDMDIPKDTAKLQKVWVMPLRIETIDSAPCTVIGVFE